MIPEGINKKIAELLHSRLNLINGELLSSEELQKEVEGAAKEIADMVFKEISSGPPIKGWVARSKSGQLALYYDRPIRIREDDSWDDLFQMIKLYTTRFSDLKWEDDPIEVELPIIRK